MPNTPQNEAILIALRRVIRAVDQQSRRLAQSHGLTGPQVLILRQVTQHGSITAAELGEALRLTAPTISDIIRRMEQRELLTRIRDLKDRRRQLITATDRGRKALEHALPLMQESFLARVTELPDWEQSQLLASLQRLAELMDASDLVAAPMLASGSATASPEALVEAVAEATRGTTDTQPDMNALDWSRKEELN
ncbi:MAG: MarR family transcriptional regulator [Gammaproteobacteria bacterium]|nr:MarR family transcriptional regulator [Gammaproteobacteria bacterium]MCP5136530.1 MarR family transcriptional regulator [Gammaproteobacteria bacterium]